MSAGDFLRRIIALLDAAAIPSMLAGSFASTFHGTPRATQDVDLVIDPTRESLEALLSRLPAEQYYVSAGAARDALARRSQFNVVDLTTGWKVDLIVRRGRPFSREEFRRRQRAEVLGAVLFVATPEDTVIAKLEWAALGDSERQVRDVAGVVAVKGEALDRAYIEKWASELGVLEIWRRAVALARVAG